MNKRYLMSEDKVNKTRKKTASRGRPKRLSQQSEAMKARIYKTALKLFKKEGFESTTLKKIAEKADISPGLIYKYYPNKEAIIVGLYDDLSADLLKLMPQLKKGKWDKRCIQTLRLCINVLGPHKEILKALIPILVGDTDNNVFSSKNNFSKQRVESSFYIAINESKNNFKEEFSKDLTSLVYTLHLGILLFWLLDKSDDNTATEKLILFTEKLLKPFSLSLRIGPAKKAVSRISKIINEGLNG